MTVKGLSHIGIPTTCFEKSRAFYATLGFAPVYESTHGAAGHRVMFLERGGVQLEVYELAETAGHPGAVDHFALAVEDIEAVFAGVKAMGHPMLDEEIQFLPFWQRGVRFFTIQGPNGEKVEFSEIVR